MEKFKELIEKLQNSLQSSLPFLKKKREEDDDDDYEDEDDESIGDKTEESIVIPKKKGKKASSDEGDDDDEEDDEVDDEEAAKKAKKKKLIQVGLVVLIIGLAASEFMPSGEDEEGLPDVQVERPNRPKRVKTPPAEGAPEGSEVVETAVVEQAVTPEPTLAPTVVAENDSFEELTFETTPAPTVAAPAPAIVEDDFEELTVPTPTYEPVVLGEATPAPSQSEMLQQMVESNPVPTTNFDLTQRVEEELTYQGEPNYEKLGRGLVYNCKGKHWACVDRDEYMKCGNNQKVTKGNNEKPECVIAEVYAEYQDCKTVQIYNINMAVSTSFCDGASE